MSAKTVLELTFPDLYDQLLLPKDVEKVRLDMMKDAQALHDQNMAAFELEQREREEQEQKSLEGNKKKVRVRRVKNAVNSLMFLLCV